VVVRSTANANPKHGRPPKVSRDAVVAAATALADESGLDAVTIRGVAARLGVAPMTLYGHVANAEELVDLVVGATIASAVSAAVKDRSVRHLGGRDTLIAFGRGLRELLLEHPAVLAAYRRGPIQDQVGLSVTEHVMAALVADGLSDEAAVEHYAAVYAFVVGFVSLEARDARLDPVDMASSGFPTLDRLAPHLATMFDPPTFERGLTALVASVSPA